MTDNEYHKKTCANARKESLISKQDHTLKREQRVIRDAISLPMIRLQNILVTLCLHDRNERTNAHTHTHTHTQPFNGFCPGQPGQAGTRRNTHPLTPNMIIGHPLSSRSIYNYPRHPLCSFYVFHNPLGQPISSRSSLVFLLVLDPELHTPCISSPNHHHLFAADAHTNAACSAAKPMLCHLYLVSLSAPYLGVCLLA